MRLFTGLDLPAEVVANLEELLRRLKPTARIKWSPPANLHITTKFIGEWPEERLDELKAALGGLPGRAAIPVRIRRRGVLSQSAFAARLLVRHRGARPGRTGRRHRCAPRRRSASRSEKRAFSPHLTLARIKERVELAAAARGHRGAAVARVRQLPGGRLLSLPEQLAADRFRVH